jgi:dTDP-4-amino-4,6-dideoxygalactose transaminase
MEFRDLKAQYIKYKLDIDKSIAQVLDNGIFIGGNEVTILEDRLSQYTGVKHCITCANGTEAMTLVLMAWDIGPGDAVFVPDFTFFSTAEVVSFRGATPIFIDVDEKTFNIDYNKLEIAIQKVLEIGELKPRVIIPVDLFGLPANYPELRSIATKYGLRILEDAAQGFGGNIDGKQACSFGDVSTTSFFPAKPLGCYGDGGAIFTDDDDLSDLLRSFKVHGKGSDKYDNVRVGVNSRLDTIQAAVLNVKLTAFVEHELDDVNRVAEVYSEKLNGLVQTPCVPKGYLSSYAQYTIKCNNSIERNRLQNDLKNNGIPSMIYYAKPLHAQKAFLDQRRDNYYECDVTNQLCETVLSLPMHPYLSNDDIQKVVDVVHSSIIR